jgi:hypothetical protein
MFVTTHVLAGALIGRALGRHPIGAFAVGVVSHMAMDCCPHWGIETDTPEGYDRFLRAARCDGCAGLAAMALGAGLAPGSSRRSVVAGMLGGAVPDLDKPFEHFLGFTPFPEKFQNFHKRIQNESTSRLPLEVVYAVALAAAALVLVPARRTTKASS